MCSDCRRPRTPARHRRCQRPDAARAPLREPIAPRAGAPSDLASLYVTRHAVERLGEHHADADLALAASLLAAAVEIDPGLAAGLVRRRLEGVQDHYLLTADGRGMFVVARARPELGPAWVVVTYLRLGVVAARAALKLGRRAA